MFATTWRLHAANLHFFVEHQQNALESCCIAPMWLGPLGFTKTDDLLNLLPWSCTQPWVSTEVALCARWRLHAVFQHHSQGVPCSCKWQKHAAAPQTHCSTQCASQVLSPPLTPANSKSKTRYAWCSPQQACPLRADKLWLVSPLANNQI